jgi:hypothetical protein
MGTSYTIKWQKDTSNWLPNILTKTLTFRFPSFCLSTKFPFSRAAELTAWARTAASEQPMSSASSAPQLRTQTSPLGHLVQRRLGGEVQAPSQQLPTQGPPNQHGCSQTRPSAAPWPRTPTSALTSLTDPHVVGTHFWYCTIPFEHDELGVKCHSFFIYRKRFGVQLIMILCVTTSRA